MRPCAAIVAVVLVCAAACGSSQATPTRHTQGHRVEQTKVGVAIVSFERPMFLQRALQQLSWQTLRPSKIVRFV